MLSVSSVQYNRLEFGSSSSSQSSTQPFKAQETHGVPRLDAERSDGRSVLEKRSYVLYEWTPVLAEQHSGEKSPKFDHTQDLERSCLERWRDKCRELASQKAAGSLFHEHLDSEMISKAHWGDSAIHIPSLSAE
nr:hypothetical protein CFP56_09951 [Quercus suber]